MLFDEHALVVERLNAEEMTRAALVKLAISAVLSKQGGTLWRDQMTRLDATTIAREGNLNGGTEG